ncbi:MAG: hypothetical protein IJ087_11895, partial [Eggerthellaceae bacterium]|nr:hypothetical protein [Eggerthellaceae bacterium]
QLVERLVGLAFNLEDCDDDVVVHARSSLIPMQPGLYTGLRTSYQVLTPLSVRPKVEYFEYRLLSGEASS